MDQVKYLVRGDAACFKTLESVVKRLKACVASDLVWEQMRHRRVGLGANQPWRDVIRQLTGSMQALVCAHARVCHRFPSVFLGL